MPQGTYTPTREKISFDLIKLKKGGEMFEIALKDANKALEFRQGKKIDIRDVLEMPKVFSDIQKGDVASPAKTLQWLGTADPLEAAKVVLEKGELALTQEQRKAMFEVKKKKIVEYIHRNASDPKTGMPHPVQRIEFAMEQAKVHIDPYQSAESQIEPIIKQIRVILPISMEKFKIRVTIPAKYSGTAYSPIKSKFDLQNEKWEDDGSVSFTMEGPAGIKPDVFNFINNLTSGEAEIEDVKEKI